MGSSHASYLMFLLLCKGGVDEIIFTWWSSDKPNNITYECVCVDLNGKPAWAWTDCSCAEPRQFVCIKSRKKSISYIGCNLGIWQLVFMCSIGNTRYTFRLMWQRIGELDDQECFKLCNLVSQLELILRTIIILSTISYTITRRQADIQFDAIH